MKFKILILTILVFIQISNAKYSYKYIHDIPDGWRFLDKFCFNALGTEGSGMVKWNVTKGITKSLFNLTNRTAFQLGSCSL